MVITDRVVGDLDDPGSPWPLTFGEAAEELRKHIDRLGERKTPHVVLNLSAVPTLDSTGLGEILRAQQLLSKRAGSLRLVGVGEAVHDVFRVTRVVSRLEILDSEDSVLKESQPS